MAYEQARSLCDSGEKFSCSSWTWKLDSKPEQLAHLGSRHPPGLPDRSSARSKSKGAPSFIAHQPFQPESRKLCLTLCTGPYQKKAQLQVDLLRYVHCRSLETDNALYNWRTYHPFANGLHVDPDFIRDRCLRPSAIQIQVGKPTLHAGSRTYVPFSDWHSSYLAVCTRSRPFVQHQHVKQAPVRSPMKESFVRLIFERIK